MLRVGKPQRYVGRLHGARHDADQIRGQRIEVGFVPEARRMVVSSALGYGGRVQKSRRSY